MVLRLPEQPVQGNADKQGKAGDTDNVLYTVSPPVDSSAKDFIVVENCTSFHVDPTSSLSSFMSTGRWLGSGCSSQGNRDLNHGWETQLATNRTMPANSVHPVHLTSRFIVLLHSSCAEYGGQSQA